MTPVPLQSIASPDLAALLRQLRTDIFYNFNCHQVGQIISFDASNQTAQVQISVLRQVPDPTKNPPVYVPRAYPLLVTCPVFIQSGGSGHLTFPIVAGDPCLVLFNDRDLDVWWTTGNTAVPNSDRAHDLSDGLVLVGFRNKANALSGYNTSDAELAFAGGKLKVNDKLAMIGASTDLKTVMDKLYSALTALNGKTGPTAITQILAFQTEYNNLLQ